MDTKIEEGQTSTKEAAKIKIITEEEGVVVIITFKIRTDSIILTKVVKKDKTIKRCYADILNEQEIANMVTNVHMHMDNRI